jgi:hypothetical protein
MQGVKKYLLYKAKLGNAYLQDEFPALSLFYQSVKREVVKLESVKVVRLGDLALQLLNLTTFSTLF